MRKTFLLSMVAVWMTGCASLKSAAPTPAVTVPAPSAEAATAALKDSPRHGEWVDITMPGTDVKLRSWVVYPESKGKAGVVIVIHEIFGLSDWVRGVTDNLAANGFIAIAPDFLSGMGPNGGGTESLGQNVQQTIRQISPDDQAKKLDAARAYALKIPAANGKIGVVGYCWGGAAVFNYAVRQPALNAGVVYYGQVPLNAQSAPDKDQLAKIKAPILGMYGGNDARITTNVEPTKAAMTELGKSYEPHVYEGAGHGFLRQQGGQDGANLKASQAGWPLTVEFFRKHLK